MYVRNDDTGEVVYEGPDVNDVPQLMRELTTELNLNDDTPGIIQAGMAHLNLVMIHPFWDGNGRMTRCLRRLVLARGGVLTPVFMSVEEYLGRNTVDYYRILAEVGTGSWRPTTAARPWIRFLSRPAARQGTGPRTSLGRGPGSRGHSPTCRQRSR